MAGITDDHGMSHRVGLNLSRFDRLTNEICAIVHVPFRKDFAEERAGIWNFNESIDFVFISFPIQSWWRFYLTLAWLGFVYV